MDELAHLDRLGRPPFVRVIARVGPVFTHDVEGGRPGAARRWRRTIGAARRVGAFPCSRRKRTR